MNDIEILHIVVSHLTKLDNSCVQFHFFCSFTPGDLFIGYQDDTPAAVVFRASNFNTESNIVDSHPASSDEVCNITLYPIARLLRCNNTIIILCTVSFD